MEYVRPPLTARQQIAFFCPEKLSFIEGSTKSGKTHSGLVWLDEVAILFEDTFPGIDPEGKVLWWVAPVYNQAKIAYRRMKIALERTVMKCSFNSSELAITFPNGVRMEFKSGEKPDNLYGEDVYAVMIDEASRMREASWDAIVSTLTATRGYLRAIGNVKGRKNWFFKMCRRAQSGMPNTRFTMMTAKHAVQDGVLDIEQIKMAKSLLPKAVFNELYLCMPTDDEGNPFGISNIKRSIRELSSKPAVVYGVDLAKKVDYTVIVGLDEDGVPCEFKRFNRKSWTRTVEIIRQTCNGVPTFVDATGIGDRIVEELQETPNYGTFYEGYIFTQQSKQALMESLEVAFDKGEVFALAGVMQDELEAFEYELKRNGSRTYVRYSAPEGMHDDTVCALALAYKHLAKAKKNMHSIVEDMTHIRNDLDPFNNREY